MTEPRVLFATYPWAFETPGGGEIQLLEYERNLAAAGHPVRRHDPWSNDLSNADLVHFFSCMGGSIHFCNYVKSRGLKLVVSSSLWITEETRSLYPIGEITAQLGLADAIVTNGDVESDRLAEVLELDRSRFHTIRNACDPIFAAPVDAALFRDAYGIEGPFILNVANVEPRKNQRGLVAAAKALGMPLVVMGHARSPDYAAACWADGGDLVRYLGPIDHRSPLLRSAYAACSVFCLPSTLETPGLAALEAAAAGARLVVTAEGSTREYFGESAHYVRSDDADDIARGIAASLAAPADPSLRDRVAGRYTWNRVVEPLAALYAELCGPAPSTRGAATR
ncbi:glycosyltransferase [Aurantimonas sp. Leaf443]|uniref:glycosyltransferase n=1 Tax=Aurantimonas sp. Leaf443 TaxID=1736378 RepID=UPI000AF8444D|nr:glycosyltransferase [Aurantimonas sp. Leaf443]